MNKISVKAVILDQGKEQTDIATISIRVGYKGKSRYKETDYRVPVNQWDKKTQQIKKEFANHKYANAHIQKQRATIFTDLDVMKKDPKFSITTIERYLRGDSNDDNSFSKFVKKYANAQLDLKKREPGTVKNYFKNLNKFHEFAGRDDVHFDEIDEQMISEYESWLRKPKVSPVHTNSLPNSDNTIWDSVTKFFSKFFNEAGKTLPDYDWPQPGKSNKQYLTLAEVDRIEKILDQLQGYEYEVAVYFLLECYSGIRHSDWKRFRVEKLIEHESLKVYAKKNEEPIHLSLKNRPRLKAILKRIARTPATRSLEQANVLIKLVGARAGIKKHLTTHVARHTFAILHAEMGYSIEFVSHMLGISIRAAEWYYKVTRRKLANEEERIGKGL